MTITHSLTTGTPKTLATLIGSARPSSLVKKCIVTVPIGNTLTVVSQNPNFTQSTSTFACPATATQILILEFKGSDNINDSYDLINDLKFSNAGTGGNLNFILEY